MNKDKLILGIGILFTLTIISVAGWLYYKSEQSTVNSEQQTVTITPTPEPTKVPEINYKNMDIQVLNGSGIAGVAKTYADKLTALGYTKVSVGNYEKTEGNLLFAPTDLKEDLEKIGLNNYKYEKSDIIKIVIGGDK